MFVINADDHKGKGTHFVAMKNSNGYCMYFDSFGLAPLPEVLQLMKTRKDKAVYNTYRIQPFNSVKCGYFCLDFLDSVHDYKSYNRWLLNYSPSNLEGNDGIVMHRLGL